jgi:hypothetical protein
MLEFREGEMRQWMWVRMLVVDKEWMEMAKDRMDKLEARMTRTQWMIGMGLRMRRRCECAERLGHFSSAPITASAMCTLMGMAVGVEVSREGLDSVAVAVVDLLNVAVEALVDLLNVAVVALVVDLLSEDEAVADADGTKRSP